MLMNNIEIKSILNGSYLYIFIIPIVVVIALILILNRNVRKSLRGIGIVLGISGVLTLGISYIIPTILNLFSSELGAYIGIINPILDTFMQKLMFTGLLEFITGLILVVVSFIMKKDIVDEETL